MAEVEEVRVEVCRERPCRQDKRTRPLSVPVFVVSWSPQCGHIEERVNSGLASDPQSFGSLLLTKTEKKTRSFFKEKLDLKCVFVKL